ncbi:hypothetical protein IBX73_11775 [candidate division WOR-3 bacterium]|nr:hypothetical protein [candidate division WOR-3 bacterium]
MYHAIRVVLTVVLLSVGCRFPDYPIDELLTAPELIEIGGRELFVEAQLYRGFQPVCPPDGNPMFAVIWVVPSDSMPFPTSVDFDYLWVVNKEYDVWVTGFDEARTAIEDNKLRKMAFDGPKWDVEPYPVLADVVVRVTDGHGNAYLLRAADQIISILW